MMSWFDFGLITEAKLTFVQKFLFEIFFQFSFQNYPQTNKFYNVKISPISKFMTKFSPLCLNTVFTNSDRR